MTDLKEYLEEKFVLYNTRAFIEDDPISIPHEFSQALDIEIAGLFSALIAWGNRKSILKSANKLMEAMDWSPSAFILGHSEGDLNNLNYVQHRTFKPEDFKFFVEQLRSFLSKHNTIGDYFQTKHQTGLSFPELLGAFKHDLLLDPTNRAQKHISNPLKGSSAKRLCMYFRWMVRKDAAGVDFGIWHNKIPSSILHLPLDVHTGNVGRSLGLLNRKQNDWKAVEEITLKLKEFDPNDPIKYDFALFGLGAIEGF